MAPSSVAIVTMPTLPAWWPPAGYEEITEAQARELFRYLRTVVPPVMADARRLHPEAFVPTFEEERSVDPALLGPEVQTAWISDGSFLLGAYHHDQLVGAAGIRRSPRHKQRHKATLWILFAHPSVQGHGIGRRLLEAALDRCRRTPELELLHLTVGTESAAARRLYLSVGFQPYGMEPQSMKLEDHYIDVELMALRLHP